MKNLILMFLLVFSATLFGQTKIENKVVETGCGMCMFKVKSAKGCAVFVKIDNQFYAVEGLDKKVVGTGHEDDGYCKVIKKARVSGEIKKGKFYATSFNYVDKEM